MWLQQEGNAPPCIPAAGGAEGGGGGGYACVRLSYTWAHASASPWKQASPGIVFSSSSLSFTLHDTFGSFFWQEVRRAKPRVSFWNGDIKKKKNSHSRTMNHGTVKFKAPVAHRSKRGNKRRASPLVCGADCLLDEAPTVCAWASNPVSVGYNPSLTGQLKKESFLLIQNLRNTPSNLDKRFKDLLKNTLLCELRASRWNTDKHQRSGSSLFFSLNGLLLRRKQVQRCLLCSNKNAVNTKQSVWGTRPHCSFVAGCVSVPEGLKPLASAPSPFRAHYQLCGFAEVAAAHGCWNPIGVINVVCVKQKGAPTRHLSLTNSFVCWAIVKNVRFDSLAKSRAFSSIISHFFIFFFSTFQFIPF